MVDNSANSFQGAFPHLGNNAFGTWNQNKLNQFYLFEQIDYDQYVKHIVQINPFRFGRTKITRGQEGEL